MNWGSRLGMVLLLGLVWGVGCSKPADPSRKPTFPVTGMVTVDGSPTAGVQVELFANNVSAGSVGMTDEQGKFQITTYDFNDGAPVGDYVAVCTWTGLQVFGGDAAPQDKLKKRYADPAKSTFKVKVEADKTTDMGTLALTTK